MELNRDIFESESVQCERAIWRRLSKSDHDLDGNNISCDFVVRPSYYKEIYFKFSTNFILFEKLQSHPLLCPYFWRQIVFA